MSETPSETPEIAPEAPKPRTPWQEVKLALQRHEVAVAAFGPVSRESWQSRGLLWKRLGDYVNFKIKEDQDGRSSLSTPEADEPEPAA